MKALLLIGSALVFAAPALARTLRVENFTSHEVWASYGAYDDESGDFIFDGWYRVDANNQREWETGDNQYAYLRLENGYTQVTRDYWPVCIHPEEGYTSYYAPQYDGDFSFDHIMIDGYGSASVCGQAGTAERQFEEIDFGDQQGFEYDVRE
jgi:hypothetical protein